MRKSYGLVVILHVSNYHLRFPYQQYAFRWGSAPVYLWPSNFMVTCHKIRRANMSTAVLRPVLTKRVFSPWFAACKQASIESPAWNEASIGSPLYGGKFDACRARVLGWKQRIRFFFWYYKFDIDRASRFDKISPKFVSFVEDIAVIVLNLILLVFRPMRKQVFSQTFACTHDIYHHGGTLCVCSLS